MGVGVWSQVDIGKTSPEDRKTITLTYVIKTICITCLIKWLTHAMAAAFLELSIQPIILPLRCCEVTTSSVLTKNSLCKSEHLKRAWTFFFKILSH